VVAYLVFRGVVRLDSGQFFGVTGLMLAFFAGGLLTTVVHELTEFGWLPETRVAWSTAELLAQGSPVGALLKAVLGYRDTPTTLEASAWLLYVSLLATWFLGGLRPRGRAAEVPAGEL